MLGAFMTTDFLWWRDGIIYQIYPRSFADSNGDGIGDLNGIRGKLGYLTELGVDALWLSPIFDSPDIDFGYDISNYYCIDSKFGTMKDFEGLVKEAHQKGLRIILDMVMNHTSNQHAWFKKARSSCENPYHNWYLWQDPAPNGKAPNNWQSMNGGSGWEYVSELDQYYFHMFYKEQPDLNWHNPKVRQAMLKAFRFWLDKGVDGYRLDLVNLYFKDRKFRNNPPKFGFRAFDQQKHIYDTDQPEMLPLLREMRQIVDEKPERYLVGEPFIAISPLDFLYSGTAAIAAPYCRDDLLHAIFCFDFLHSFWDAKRFRKSILDWENSLTGKGWPTYVLANHDNPRIATRYTRDENDARLKAAALMLLSLRGTPFIYNGDEIGMRNIHIKRSQIKDPVGKLYWPIFKGRDGCRAPLQWSADSNAGFSKGATPWLPVHPNNPTRNVEQQNKDPHSLLNFYRQLIHLRKKFPVLIQGDFVPLENLPSSILAYRRAIKQQTALVLINFSHRQIQLDLEDLVTNQWELLISTHRTAMDNQQSQSIILSGDEALIFVQKNS
jgi:alpha-glucosidase